MNGLTIKFNHVGGTSGGEAGGDVLGKFLGDKGNDAGSIRIGNIGGIGGHSPGYKHTHIEFTRKGRRVDPRSIFCKEFGF